MIIWKISLKTCAYDQLKKRGYALECVLKNVHIYNNYVSFAWPVNDQNEGRPDVDQLKKILLIGSEPFGGDPTNPTYEAAKLLQGMVYHGYEFCAAAFPVNRRLLIPHVEKVIEDTGADIVIGCGLADNRTEVCMERIAANVADFPIADNEGYYALNETLFENGPAAYFSTLPIRACVKALRDSGIPASVSNTAGNFCCNMTMYTALHYFAVSGKHNARAGFIHLPYTHEMIAGKDVHQASISFDVLKRAIEIAAKAAIDNETDIEMICGACS